MPTLEPMIDEETEEEDGSESSAAPSTPDHEREPSSTTSVSADDASPAFQVSPAPLTGGVGLFATRPICQGTTLFSESPLLIQRAHPSRSNTTVIFALSHRTREEQRQFFTLWNAYKSPRLGHPALLPAIGIFETNALPIVSPSGDEFDTVGKTFADGAREGVFLQASRLNHSCRPNVCRSWDPDTQEMTFRALQDIKAGEELCMSYVDVDVLGTRAQRIAEMVDAFGFTCVCEVCTLDSEKGAESDRRRAAVKRLYDEIGKCGKEPIPGLRKVKIALEFLKREQLVHYDASFCFRAFQFCVSVSDFANAKVWVRKAWESSCITTGADSPTARMLKMYWANPGAHPLAGVLPRMTLSGPD